MIEFKNKVFEGANARKSLMDAVIDNNVEAVIVFAHGYKGYKDWGCWNLMQERFIEEGFGVVKFNFSHNGGTVQNPIDFDDLNAFGENRYSYELEDLRIITNEVERLIKNELKIDVPIYLVGHSRGGGVAVLFGSKDDRIKKVVSLAGISDIGSRFPEGEELLEWERDGVRYVENGRTKQQMPHFYSYYLDFLENEEELNIQSAAEKIKIPFLQIHGDMDLAVSISEGLNLARWTNTELKIIKGAGHTFGASHPWDKTSLPEDFAEVIDDIIIFFKT